MTLASIASEPPPSTTQLPSVGAVGDEEAVAWDGCVQRTPGATLYHLYEWRRIVRSVFGCETHYLAARRAGSIAGVLPLVRLKSLLFGDFLVSMPYVNYGGVLADSPEMTTELLTAAEALARSLGVSHMELRHSQNLLPQWPVRTDKVAMLLNLPESPEALSKALGPKVRAQIKRPVREGASCTSGGQEHLEDFYTVFAENMRDLGTPVYPRKFFRAVLAAFPAAARVFVVRVAERPVAAAIVLGFGGTLEIPWASSLRSANHIGVNMLLYWNVLEYACQQQYARFDFGRSTLDAGTFRFKKQWGAEPQQLYWHYWLRSGREPPQLNPSNPKYRAAIAAWQKLPVGVANLLGPLLVRNLP